MKAIAYMRRSQDSGSGVSEDIQDAEIREYVERKGGEVAYWLPPDLDASSWTLDRPSMKRALELLASGKADTLVVAKLSRVTRRRKDWEDLLDMMKEQGWTIRSADFDIDLSDKGGRLIAGVLIDFLGFEYEEKRDGYNAARKNAVLLHGVHGGDKAPLGYDFTVRGRDKKGNALRGPLAPNADAPKVTAMFERCADDTQLAPTWREVVAMLGVKSQSNAARIIANRVYFGTAYSGKFEKPEAHPPLVDEVTFRRANRRMKKQDRSVAYGKGEGALLGNGILRCVSCGRSLIREKNAKRGDHYRCKGSSLGLCETGCSIRAATVEPEILFRAMVHHATFNPMHVADIDLAAVAVFEDEYEKAKAELAEVERMHEASELSPSAYGKALTAAEFAVTAASVGLADAEASRGWLGMSTEAVQRRLFTDTSGPRPDPAKVRNVEEARDFVKQMVRVFVSPVGRGRRVPVAERIAVEYLAPVVAVEEAFVEFTPVEATAA